MRRLVLALAVALAACSSPNPDLYTLAALPGPVAHLALHGVEVRRISLAGYLDRPEIVRSSDAFRLRLAQNERWGEPLGGMLDRVFAEDLVERLPDTAVFSEAGAISTSPDLLLEVDVQRFDAEAGATLVLVAQVAVRHSDAHRPAEARTLRLTTPLAGPTTHDHVAAMSRALADLSDQVVALLGAAARAPDNE